MISYATCNIILLYILIKYKEFNINILKIGIFLALIIFSTTMVLYPKNDIRIMWYLFIIMIAYFVGGNKIGNITTISSLVILFYLNNIFNLNFNALTQSNIIIGILFISQLSNYIR